METKDTTFLVPLVRGEIKGTQHGGAEIANTPLAGVPHPKGGMLIAHQNGEISKFRKGEMRPWTDVGWFIRDLPKWSFGPSFSDERGLLGVVLHPHYGDKESVFHNRFFAAITCGDGKGGFDNTLLVYEFEKNGKNIGCIRALVTIPQPEPNHNGGSLLFGPPEEDPEGIGYLYISVGDGGGRGDQHGDLVDPSDPDSFLGNAQDLHSWLGKILRVSVGLDFAPDSNPFNDPTCGVRGNPIYCYGLRNVWGMSLDVETGRIFAADVGQDSFEEINILKAGANYGWRALEGGTEDDFSPDNIYNAKVLSHINGRGNTKAPIIHYDRRGKVPSAVIGGYVYRGSKMRHLQGAYIFGDYHGEVFVAHQSEADGVWRMETLVEAVEGRRLHAIMQTKKRELLFSFADDKHTHYTICKLMERVAALAKTAKDRLAEGHPHVTLYTCADLDGDPEAIAAAVEDALDKDAAVLGPPQGVLKTDRYPKLDAAASAAVNAAAVAILTDADSEAAAETAAAARREVQRVSSPSYASVVFGDEEREHTHSPSNALDDADIRDIHRAVRDAARRTSSGIRRSAKPDENTPCAKMVSAVILRHGSNVHFDSVKDAWEGAADIAEGKAYTALAFSSNENAMSTRTIGHLSNPKGPLTLWGIGHTNGNGAGKHGIVEFPGGVPLYKNGVLVGGLGVSGDTPDIDEKVAWSAVQQMGFEPPEHIVNEPFVASASHGSAIQCSMTGCTNMGAGACPACRTTVYCSNGCMEQHRKEHAPQCGREGKEEA